MTPEPLSPDHVQEVLNKTGLRLTVEHFTDSTRTSEDAAAAIGCRLGQIAKSMCFLVGGDPVLVVAGGDQKVADAKIARHFAIGRKKVKIASPEQCLEIFGYPPGGVSPVGHRTPGIPIVLDKLLWRWEIVYAAAGTPHDNFSCTPEQLKTITAGTVLDCVKD